MGLLIIRILLFGVLYEGPLFPDTPISSESQAGAEASPHTGGEISTTSTRLPRVSDPGLSAAFGALAFGLSREGFKAFTCWGVGGELHALGPALTLYCWLDGLRC